MAIQQNQRRIRTTHIGSLPRPRAVLDLLKTKLNGQPYDEKALDATVAAAVADQVKKQVECGIDIVSDGEMSKAGFFTYIRERLEGFESRPNEKVALFQKEVSASLNTTSSISRRRCSAARLHRWHPSSASDP